jgi:hypothetical protein
MATIAYREESKSVDSRMYHTVRKTFALYSIVYSQELLTPIAIARLIILVFETNKDVNYCEQSQNT